jgi:uncharacterized membrane protein YcaP (DUF421 family)
MLRPARSTESNPRRWDVLLASVANSLFSMGIPISEKVVRTILVYGGLLLLLRVGGKRTAAQLNAFDLVVLLLVSNVVQNAIIGPDNSLVGGLLGVLVLVAVNDLVIRLVRRNAMIDRAFEGSETKVVEHGEFVDRELRRYGIRVADLDAALRRSGADHVSEVKEAGLYPSGALVVDLDPKAQSASREDVQRLERKLDLLAASVARLSQGGS